MLRDRNFAWTQRSRVRKPFTVGVVCCVNVLTASPDSRSRHCDVLSIDDKITAHLSPEAVNFVTDNRWMRRALAAAGGGVSSSGPLSSLE